MKLDHISIFAGHSGGHLFPAVAFCEKLRSRFPESRICLVTSQKGRKIVEKIPAGTFDSVYYLPEFPSPAGISFRSILFLLQLGRAFFLSSQYLSKAKPDLCVGFGSYVSYPGMLLSGARRIPTLIHEQNVIPGKASEWLARHVDCVAVSFENSFSGWKLARRECVGLPLRSALVRAGSEIRKRASDFLPQKFDSSKPFNILIVGGSQGARQLNRIVVETFSHLSREEMSRIAVTHITGSNDSEWVRGEYEKLGLEARVYPFFENMHELYSRADMALTRAGANTLFELALFAVPAVVIPYPFAGGHQEANAAYFESRQAVILQQEKNLNCDWLIEKIRSFIQNPDLLKRLSNAIAKLAQPDAAEKLVRTAEQLFEEPSPWKS